MMMTPSMEMSKKQKNSSVLGNLRLVKDHLILKFASISPDVKCSEIIASINTEKVTPEIIETVQDFLMLLVTIGLVLIASQPIN